VGINTECEETRGAETGGENPGWGSRTQLDSIALGTKTARASKRQPGESGQWTKGESQDRGLSGKSACFATIDPQKGEARPFWGLNRRGEGKLGRFGGGRPKLRKEKDLVFFKIPGRE